MNNPFPFRNIALATVGLGLLGGVSFGGWAVSQTPPLQAVQWDNRRLDQLDRNVRRLERALTQRNAQGQPVLVEPDPEVIALQGRVSQMDRRLQDLEQTFQRVNGDLERMTFQSDEGERDSAALRSRLTDADARIRALEEAMRAQAQAVQEAAEADRSPTGDAVADLAAARALTDSARGQAALEAVMAHWPDTPQAREAGWRLGDLRRSAADMPGAVQAYAGALQGWPTAAWAPEVTLKLAGALEATDRDTQACGALGEFNRRYAASASAQLKAIAAQIRGRAGCT